MRQGYRCQQKVSLQNNQNTISILSTNINNRLERGLGDTDQKNLQVEMMRPEFVKVLVFDSGAPNPKTEVEKWLRKIQKDVNLVFQIKKCFVTWDDKESPPHDKRFTSIFICPTTLEKFTSGNWGILHSTSKERDDQGAFVDVNWFSRKNDAEHAAAAKFLKSSYFRDWKASNLFGDAPYKVIDRCLVLPSSSALPIIIEDAEIAAIKAGAEAVLDNNSFQKLTADNSIQKLPADEAVITVWETIVEKKKEKVFLEAVHCAYFGIVTKEIKKRLWAKDLKSRTKSHEEAVVQEAVVEEAVVDEVPEESEAVADASATEVDIIAKEMKNLWAKDLKSSKDRKKS